MLWNIPHVPRTQRYYRATPRAQGVARDSKKRGAFPFVRAGTESAHARMEVIARDTQANAALYAPRTLSMPIQHVRGNICPKNRVRIGPNSWNSLTKLFVPRDPAATQAISFYVSDLRSISRCLATLL